ncbi:hypothetical protein GCM10027361_02060 [Erwinia aphidicola]|jgi:hypothetical protein|uniref:DUF7164 domain-containing protein n=1 Tax=Erwinia aphidicola TaxID=68334 RepID=UPI0017477027|nr:hypothetical protein [Erwinia aphidicola]MBD1377086.1 hypothetical protein [Erwinia aphidicola]
MDNINKKMGIVTYIDNTENMLQEFTWLYKSWIHSGSWRTSDLIIVHHPAIGGQLPQEPGIRLIAHEPLSQTDPLFHDYHFINSIACLSGPHIDPIIKQYQWLLRTDADVFLTPYFANFTPAWPVHGCGGYHLTEDFRQKMLDFCRRQGVNHTQRFGCGHSIILPAELMIAFLQRQVYWCYKLAEDFGSDSANWGAWPGWYRGVLTMYAAEIAANEGWDKYLREGRERILDMNSSSHNPIDALTLHIHSSHYDIHFSKHQYRAGSYAAIDPHSLDIRCIDDYCLWICMTPIDTIKAQAFYLR